MTFDKGREEVAFCGKAFRNEKMSLFSQAEVLKTCIELVSRCIDTVAKFAPVFGVVAFVIVALAAAFWIAKIVGNIVLAIAFELLRLCAALGIIYAFFYAVDYSCKESPVVCQEARDALTGTWAAFFDFAKSLMAPRGG